MAFMMKRYSLLFTLCKLSCYFVFLFSNSWAVDQKPIIVLYEYDHWGNPYRADSPIFALYENGLLIYEKHNDSDSREYFSVTLSEEEISQFMDSIHFHDNLIALDDYYDGNRSTFEGPLNELFIWVKSKYKCIEVYGDLSNQKSRQNLTIRPDSLMENALKNDSLLQFEIGIPESFVRAFDVLAGYDNTNALAWTPAKIEVMIWPYEYYQGIPMSWPKDWGGIDQKDTRQLGDEYILLLDYTLRGQLSSLINTIGDTIAVELSGEKWAIAYRIPFPGEELLKKKEGSK